MSAVRDARVQLLRRPPMAAPERARPPVAPPLADDVERDAPYAWAARVLRERTEREHGEGLSVDRVVGEIRQRRRRDGG
jgi:hypothetical protein